MNFYELKKKKIRPLLVFIVLTLFFYSLTLTSKSSEYLYFKYQFEGWCGVVFFGFFTLLTLIGLLQRGPAVVINENGISYNRSIFKLIPWEGIENIRRLQFGQCIELKVPNRNFYLKGIIGFLNKRLNSNCTTIGISFSFLTPNIDEFLEYIQKHYPDKMIERTKQ